LRGKQITQGGKYAEKEAITVPVRTISGYRVLNRFN
jgi:hypothetical protein